jgi:hypothetical protein
VVRVADVAGDEGGFFDVTITAPYVPTGISLQPAVTQLGGLVLDVNKPAEFFRINPLPDSDVLAIELRPDNPASGLAVWLTIVSENAPTHRPNCGRAYPSARRSKRDRAPRGVRRRGRRSR